MTPLSPARFGRALTATILSALLAAPANARAAPVAPAAFAPAPVVADKPKFAANAFESLKSLIETTPLEKMDLDFFKKVYRQEHAPDMLKLIFGRPELETKSSRLGELRKFYDWSIQAEWARKNHVVIENTNQGKDNGARSDLDATANVLEFDRATGDWVIRDKAVAELIRHQKEGYARDGLSPDGVDVTLFNGDVWLPDWRDVRMSYREFAHQLTRNAWELKQRKGAYYAPGAYQEQAYDRALREGHTVHIGWDYVAGRPSINGFPVQFDPKTGKVVWLAFDAETGAYKTIGPVVELPTREAAARGQVARYQGVEALAPGEGWRRAFGNIVQNTDEFFKPHDAVSRNKYFIERVIDQGAGRFTHLENPLFDLAAQADPNVQPTYVQIHAAAPERLSDAEKLAWKRSFIQQAFGLPDPDARIAEIQSVLDRSSEIQLDKTKKRAAYADRARRDAPDYYYADEWAKAVENTEPAVKELQAQAAAEGKPVSAAELVKLQEREAERLFVEKQRRVIIEGAIQVAKETFQRDFPEETHARRDRFSEPDVAKKIMFERGVELALLMDLIESAPEISPVLRDKLRAAVIQAIPEASRSLVANLAEISKLKLGLAGRVADKRLGEKLPSELLAEVAEEMKARFGETDSAAPAVGEDTVREAIREMIRKNLGPVDAPKFEEAWQAGKTALIAKFGGQAYVKEIVEQADFLMLSGAALGLVHAYQQHCIGQTSWNEECVLGLASETGNQVMFLLPGINTGWMILGGLKSIGEGRVKEGSTSLALGVFSLPSVSGMLGVPGAMFVKMYVGLQILALGAAVTYGYAVQTMENDAVEQAFKALREPGRQARPYLHAGRSSVFTGDTPTLPLLADVITGKGKKGEDLVPADGWDDRERNRVALAQNGKAIDAELKQLGLQAGSPEWEARKSEITVRYAALVPYLQRTANIYQVFGPKVEAKEKELGKDQDLSSMRDCLESREDEVEKKYQGPPSIWDRLRFWRDAAKDKQADLAAVWSACVQKAAQDDQAILAPVFDQYLDGWLQQQTGSARTQYEAPEMRVRLRTALINEYVVHRHLDQGYESERQMKKAVAQAKQASAARIQLMGKMLQTEKRLQQEIGEKLKQAADRSSAATRPEVKPELTLRAPPFAVRIGAQAFVDFAVRGQYYREDQPDGAKRNEWNADLQGEVVKVALGQPDNLIMTKELERELQPEPGKLPKRLVTIEEQLKGELKDGAGSVLATAETVARYFDVVEWEGRIEVETRAAGPQTKNPADTAGTYAYSGATVKLSGPASAQKESQLMGFSDSLAGAIFKDLPEGKFSVHVDPQPDDKHHRAAEAAATLTGVSSENVESQPRLVLGKDRDSLVVVLPYVASKEPTETARQQPNQPAPGSRAGGESAPRPGKDPAGEPPAADVQRVADCNALISKARAALAGHDLAAASSLLGEAQQKNCTEVPAVANGMNGLASGIAGAQADRNAHIQQLQSGIGQQMGACDYEKALALAQQLAEVDPGNAWVTANLARLQQLAAEQSRIRSLLSAVQGSMPANEVQGTLAQLRQSLATAPACMAPPINAAIRELERRAAQANIEGLANQIRALFEACDYVKALAVAQQLQAVAPADPWLAANLGRLQATAAEQAGALALLRAAHEAAPDKDGTALLAQLRQSLGTAPACMADPIRAAIADLERRAIQKPAWLQDSPSKPASDRNPGDTIEQARDTLRRTATDEENRLARLEEQRRQAEQRRQEEDRRARAEAERRAADDAEQQRRETAEEAERRRQNAQRRAERVSGILQSLSGVIANRGRVPIPSIPSGGGTPAARDIFEGTWVGYGVITASRGGNDPNKRPIADASVNPGQSDTTFTISKSGTGYTFEKNGQQIRSRFVSGNKIGFSKTGNVADGRPISLTTDVEVNGNKMTGVQRAEGADGSFIVWSINCTRQ